MFVKALQSRNSSALQCSFKRFNRAIEVRRLAGRTASIRPSNGFDAAVKRLDPDLEPV